MRAASQATAQATGGYRQSGQEEEPVDDRVRKLPFTLRTKSGRVVRHFASQVEAEEYVRRMTRYRGLPRKARSPTPSTDPALWTVRRRFGVAGGPDEVVLTDAGMARAFSVGAKVKEGAASKALEALWVHNREGQLSTRAGARHHTTDLGTFDQIAWGHLRSKGYVESIPPDGVRLTEAGKRATRDGFEERKYLLQRCKQAAAHTKRDL